MLARIKTFFFTHQKITFNFFVWLVAIGLYLFIARHVAYILYAWFDTGWMNFVLKVLGVPYYFFPSFIWYIPDLLELLRNDQLFAIPILLSYGINLLLILIVGWCINRILTKYQIRMCYKVLILLISLFLVAQITGGYMYEFIRSLIHPLINL